MQTVYDCVSEFKKIEKRDKADPTLNRTNSALATQKPNAQKDKNKYGYQIHLTVTHLTWEWLTSTSKEKDGDFQYLRKSICAGVTSDVRYTAVACVSSNSLLDNIFVHANVYCNSLIW